MTNEINENELARLLGDAADEKPGAAEAFFELLLRSDVFVPTEGQVELSKPSEIGKSHVDDMGFVTVSYEGQECLPIFTDPSFLFHWAERELSYSKHSFSSLLWLVGDSLWMYLDPNQEVGKELTSWEISLLRKGKDSIAEIVAATNENALLSVEIETGSDLYPGIKRKLLPVLELSKSLDEAFLIAVKEEGSENSKPTLGLKYGKVADAERQYIREELRIVGEDYSIVIIDDLGVGSNDNLFAEATPFFIRQKLKQSPKKPIFDSISRVLKGKWKA